jgi:hypothetical protein
MARYIDADTMQDFLVEQNDIDEWVVSQYNADWISSFIESQPTADVVEVKHGEWKPTKIHSYFGGVIYECSLCGAKDGDHTKILGRYCWRCGAKMDGGKKE